MNIEEAELALVPLVGQACQDLVADRALGRLGVVVAGERVAVAPNLRLASLMQSKEAIIGVGGWGEEES